MHKDILGKIKKIFKYSTIVLAVFVFGFSDFASVLPSIFQNNRLVNNFKIKTVQAAVANDAVSESHTGTTGSTNQASFTWNHTPVGTPRGVLVFVYTISTTKTVTGVTYGGVAMTEIAGGAAVDTANEVGRVDTFFLGSGIPTGLQTIVVNRTNNAVVMYAAAATQTAGSNTEVTGIVLLQENQAMVEQSVDDGSVGTDSLRYGGSYYGANSPAPAGANSTLLNNIDLGSFGSSMVRETIAGQGARLVGFTAASDDVAAVHLAVREFVTTLSTGTNPGDTTIAPGGSITPVNGFVLTTSSGTDAITAITVNLSTNNGVGTLTITDGADAVLGSIGGGTGSGIVAGLNSISITSTNATIGGTVFKVKVTPLSHANMPVPSGGTYVITGNVTNWTGSNSKVGQAADTSSTVTIDNLSPGGTTGASATGTNAQISVSWTNPGDIDFQKVIIYCKTSSMIAGEAPAEGSDPAVDGVNPCDGTARVKYNGSVSPQTFTGLTNGTTYYFRIYARDTNGNFTAYTSTQQVSAAPNAPPTLSISQPDGVNDKIAQNASYNITYTLSDPDNIVTAAFYYDTNNSGLDGVAITGACATAAEGVGVTCSWNTTGLASGSYYVYGIANDGINSQVSAYSSGAITINSAPVMTAVTITPATAYVTTSSLTANPSATDADSDPITYTYQWKKGGLNIVGQTFSTLSNTYYVKNDSITVEVTPNDGTVNGAPMTSGALVISNSIPVMVSVTITPSSADKNTLLLTANASATDADVADVITYSYQWKNGINDIIGQTASTLSNVHFNRGDSITVVVAPSDDMVTGLTMTSGAVVISNAPPTLSISQPASGNTAIAQNSSYNITYTLADADDVVAAAFYYETDGNGAGGTAITGACATAAEGTGVTCAFDTSVLTAGVAYYVYGVVNDGIAPAVTTVSSGTITPNAAPTFSISQPASGNTPIAQNSIYNIIYTLSDPDNIVTAAFYYEIDGNGAGGIAITGCDAKIEGINAACAFDTSVLTPGTAYYVYGVANDGVNLAVTTVSSGTITPNAAPTLSISQPSLLNTAIAQNSIYNIIYTLSDPDNIVTAAFYYETDGNGAGGAAIPGCDIKAEGADLICAFDTSVLTSGIAYYVYGVSDDLINSAVTTVSSGTIKPNAAPALSVTQPNGVADTIAQNASYNITYTLSDPDNAVTAAFYYDTNNSGLDGVAITGACATGAEGVGMTCSWDTTGVTPGNYYVYGITNDGVNAAVNAYSSGMITINAAPTLSISQPDGVGDAVPQNASYNITYTLADSDDAVTAAFYYDTNNSGLDGVAITGACAGAAEGAGAICSWDTTGVTPGDYYVYGKTSDGINSQASAYSSGVLTINPPLTTILDTGTDPAAQTIAPGASAQDIDQFTFAVNSGTDTITAITATLSPAGSYNNIALVEITDASNADKCTNITNPVSTTLSFTGCSLAVTTSPITFKIRVTPKAHADMDPPSTGVSYATKATVSGWTGTNTPHTGSDACANALTIDNLSPGGTTSANAAPSNTQIDISWIDPADGDFQKVIIYCKTSSMIAGEAPAEGSDPAVDGVNPCDGTARVKYNGSVSPQTFTGLTNGTTYYFRIYARDTHGNFTVFGSTQEVSAIPRDTTPPTPDPMTFSSVPANFSAAQIDMTATEAIDATTPPVEYYFTIDNSICALNAGIGGTSSGWQSGRSYSDIGLQPNKCYGYTVKARDSASTPNVTAASGISSTYTSANIPGAPTLSGATVSTLDLANAQNSNPASNPTTKFAAQMVTASPNDAAWINKWVDVSGSPSATEVWLTDAQLDVLTIQGLQPSTLYGVKVKARNEDSYMTDLGAEGQGTTSAPTTTISNFVSGEPSSSMIAPGASGEVDSFGLRTDIGTDTVTGANVTLAAGMGQYIQTVTITSDDGLTSYCNAAPIADSASISSCTIPVTTGNTQFKIKLTAKDHASMPVPPGGSYAVTARVTAFTSTNAQTGTDSGSATLTIDNASPSGATLVSGTAGDTANTINWTTSASSDFDITNGSIILRWASSSAGAEVPAEGNSGYAAGDTITTATIACVISSAGSTAESKIDGTGGSAGCMTAALTNGQDYTYKVFQRDTRGNYNIGTVIGTFTPKAVTTLATGTDPAAITIAPGAGAADVDLFTLQTTTGTESITSVTVNLSTGSGVGTLAVTDNSNVVLGSTDTPVTGSNIIAVSGLTASTSLTNFKIRVTPLSHASMPVPPGGTYNITAHVDSWVGTGSNIHTGTDTCPNALTIDNDSPAGTTGASAAPVGTQIDVSWTNPVDSDFQKVIIYCKTGSIVSGEAPVEGSDPSVDGTACDGTARVKYSGSTSPQSFTGLSFGVTYYFRIYVRDNNGNFTAYVSTQQVSTMLGNDPPTLSISQPNGINDKIAQNASYNITYTLADPDSVVTAAFYYDTNNSGLDGVAITGACAAAAEGAGVTCSWDTTGVVSGSYYVYGITNDGINPQVSAYSSGMITINSAPVMTAVTITPDPAYKTTALLTANPSATDADSDPITYTYQWKKGGSNIVGETSSTLSNTNYVKNDSITVEVTPNDGTVNGTPMISSALVISNSIPVMTAVTITPDPAYKTTSVLTANPSATDDDSDVIIYSYQWKKATIDIAGETASTLSNSKFNKGDSITVSVAPSDGVVTGLTMTSSAVVILNSAPTQPTVAVTTPAYDATNIVCTPSGSTDPDSDPITYTYAWYKDTVLQGSIIGDTVDAANTAVGETWKCVVTPNDGTVNGTSGEASVMVQLALDTTAPANVTDLSTSNPTASSIDLSWTAPGDDASAGTAATYDIRYSTAIITDGNWSGATEVTGEPAPLVAGTSQTMTVSGLSAGTTYYFAMKTSDEVPNISGLSNVVNLATSAALDITAPAAITSLTASNPTTSSIGLSWTAPGDDASAGTAATYDIRYSTAIITDGNWSGATEVTGEPAPLVAGTSQTMTVSGLSAGTTYYFAMKTSDEVPNISGLSNVADATTSVTVDTTAPSAVTDLVASNPTVSSIDLTWTAPGNDGSVGTAATYDIRYSTAAITDGNWSGATAVSGMPTPLIAGNSQSVTVSGLTVETTYYFAMKASDATMNISALSNIASLATSAAGGPTPTPTPTPVSTRRTNNIDTATPITVTFSGQAYPGVTIDVLRKSLNDVSFRSVPASSMVIMPDGVFNISYTGLVKSVYIYALQLKDKDGRKTTLAYDVNLLVQTGFEVRDILVPPTSELQNTVLSQTDDLAITGYATPGDTVEVELDGVMQNGTASVGGNGRYTFTASAGPLFTGVHYVRVRQSDARGRKSAFAQTKLFRRTLLLVRKADLSSDGKVNVTDWSILLYRWNSEDPAVHSTLDMNGDGKVDVTDLSIFLKAMQN